MLAVQDWERVFNILSVRRPQPYNTNPWNEKREREKIFGDEKSEHLVQ